MSPSEEATARLRRLIRDLDADVAAMDARAAELAAAVDATGATDARGPGGRRG